MTEQTPRADERIIAEVGSWPDVELADHRFGGVAFIVGRREIGHLHGDRLCDLALPKDVRAEYLAAGRITPHNALPDHPGLASVRLRQPGAVETAIELLRLNYDRAVARLRAREGAADEAEARAGAA